MKNIMFISIVMAIPITSLGQKNLSTYSCITSTSVVSNHCTSGSIELTFTNNCSEEMDVRFAIKRNNGQWEISSDKKIKAGTVSQSTTNWICEASGKYYYWAATTASNKLISPQEVKTILTALKE